MKIGVFIRSVGERTKQLCYDSVLQGIPEKNIHFIRNITPFSNAVKTMLIQAETHKYNWFFGLDADIILKENWWKDSFYDFFYKHNDYERLDQYYRVDFLAKDRFSSIPMRRGIHFYNSKYIAQMLKCLKETKNTSKPEGNIRNKIGVEELKSNITLGYHGYEQYYKDIFNRFVLRYYRNPDFVKRFKMFKDIKEKEETQIAKLGWDYGRTSTSNHLNILDASKRINIEQFGHKEIGELKLTLKSFYKKWK